MRNGFLWRADGNRFAVEEDFSAGQFVRSEDGADDLGSSAPTSQAMPSRSLLREKLICSNTPFHRSRTLQNHLITPRACPDRIFLIHVPAYHFGNDQLFREGFDGVRIDHLSVPDNGYAVAQPEDFVQPVGDIDHGNALLFFRSSMMPKRCSNSLSVNVAGRLVHDNNFRSLGQGFGDLHHLFAGFSKSRPGRKGPRPGLPG